MTIAVGGHTITTGTTVASLTTAAVATTTGSTFVAYSSSSAAFGAGTVSDSPGNTYVHSQADVLMASGKFMNVWTCQNGTGSASHTFKSTPATSQTLCLGFAEISGAAASSLDQNPAHSGPTSSAAPASPSATTTSANELLFAVLADASNVTYSVPTNSFTILDQTFVGTIVTIGSSTRVVSSTGTYSTAVTASSSHTWVGALLTFIAASGVTTISATPGAYTWAGATATTSQLINSDGAPNGWTWAGTTATTVQAVNAVVGAYSWAGTTATASGLINGGVGAYSWSGTTSGLLQNISETPGAYSWTGTTSTTSQIILGQVGAYSWSGVTATFPGALNAIPATYTWAGLTSVVGTPPSSSSVNFFLMFR